MTGLRFRLTAPTLAIVEADRSTVTIPDGAVLAVLEDVSSSPFVRVTWTGRTVLMFAVDLKERGEIVRTAG